MPGTPAWTPRSCWRKCGGSHGSSPAWCRPMRSRRRSAAPRGRAAPPRQQLPSPLQPCSAACGSQRLWTRRCGQHGRRRRPERPPLHAAAAACPPSHAAWPPLAKCPAVHNNAQHYRDSPLLPPRFDTPALPCPHSFLRVVISNLPLSPGEHLFACLLLLLAPRACTCTLPPAPLPASLQSRSAPPCRMGLPIHRYSLFREAPGLPALHLMCTTCLSSPTPRSLASSLLLARWGPFFLARQAAVNAAQPAWRCPRAPPLSQPLPYRPAPQFSSEIREFYLQSAYCPACASLLSSAACRRAVPLRCAAQRCPWITYMMDHPAWQHCFELNCK